MSGVQRTKAFLWLWQFRNNAVLFQEVINLESDEEEADDFEDAAEQFNTADDMFEEELESVPRRAQPLSMRLSFLPLYIHNH
jgi:hypothetical protein